MRSAQKPKRTFGSPEKTSILKTLFLWTLIALGIAGIAWMIDSDPPQKRLNCTRAPTTSLIGFGSCVEE
jgi:hypothetical protein